MLRRFLPVLTSGFLLTLGATANADGNALLFNGVDQFCNIPDLNDDFDFGSAFTIEAWVRVDTPQPNAGVVCTNSDSGLVAVAGSQAAAVIVTPIGQTSFQSSVAPGMSLATGVWTHAACTYDGTTMTVYVNGAQVSSNTVATPPQDVGAAARIWLGRRMDTSSFFYFAGALDEVRVWNLERTATEIQDNYDQELSGQEAGLVGYYQFDEVGQWIFDSSAAGNHGFLGAGTAVNAQDPTRIPSEAPIASNDIEGALRFDGSSSLCRIPDLSGDFDFGSAFTMEAWVRVNSPQSNAGLVVTDSDSGIIGVASGEVATIVTPVGAPNFTSAVGPSMSLPTGVWTHVAGSYDGSMVRVYANGVLQATSAASMPTQDATAILLGLRNGSNYFDGDLDEVRLWNVVRTDAQILDNYGTELVGSETGLVGYYKFNEASDSQTVFDSSLAGNHGHLGDLDTAGADDPERIPSTLMTSLNRAGGALLFDGIDDFGRVFDTNNSLDLGSEASIEAWVRFDTIGSFRGVIATNGIALYANGSDVLFHAQFAGGVLFAAHGPGVLTAGEWIHLAGTYDGSILRLYINGQEVATQLASGPTDDTAVLGLGRINPTTGYLDGAIDDVRIWNVVRSGAEIAGSVHCLADHDTSGLVAHYEFDEPFGQVLRDSSGQCNSGFLGDTRFTQAEDPTRILSDAPICSPPVNDDCGNAIDVSSGGQFAGSVISATNDGTSSCGQSVGAADVWYSYTATELGDLTVTTCGSNDLGGLDQGMDTVLALFDGCSGTELECDDDTSGCFPLDSGFMLDSQVATTVLPGETVLIRVTYFNLGGAGVPGPFVLNVNFEGGFVNLCNGDGGDQAGCTNCPCMNNASVGSIGGCLNSVGNGLRLIATGDTSVSLPSGSATDLRFGADGAPPSAFCILNSGDGLAPGGMANPCFGLNTGAQAIAFDGLRCAIMNTRRHGGRSADANGEVGVTNNPWGGEGGPPVGIAQAGPGFAAGQTRYFQIINRDDALLSCMRGLNTSQAVGLTFTP